MDKLVIERRWLKGGRGGWRVPGLWLTTVMVLGPIHGHAAQATGEQKASAQAGSAQESNAQSEGAEPYLFAPGDRVSITVFDQTEISGTYLVEPMGTITLPLVGPIDVTQFTPEGLQADLVQRFGSGYLQNPVISVRLTELRPLTIVGSVRAPGRYAYIDGMTIETALALAGGLARLTNETVAQRSDFLQTDERLKSLKIAYLGQLARKARLDAQLGGSKTIEAPGVGMVDSDMMQRLIEGEREILTFQSTSQDRQLGLLQEQSRQVEGDVAAFQEQSALQQEQIDYLDDQIKDFKGLLVNGLTKKSSVIDLQREKSKSRSDLSRIMSDLARSKSSLAEINLKLAELDTSYRSRLMTDLQETKLKLAEVEGGIPLVTEARQIKLDQMPIDAQPASGALTLRISRYRHGRMDVLDATMTTALWPGDILQAGSGSASAGGVGAPATTGPGSLQIAPPQDPASGDASSFVPATPDIPAVPDTQRHERISRK